MSVDLRTTNLRYVSPDYPVPLPSILAANFHHIIHQIFRSHFKAIYRDFRPFGHIHLDRPI